jgi:hypothetical protein
LTFASSCREWGIDPAAEIEDPFLAHQLRIGLLVKLRESEQHQSEEDRDKAERRALVDSHPERIETVRRTLGRPVNG